MMLKKALSFFMALVMTLNLSMVFVFAESTDVSKTSFAHDGYSVDYIVKSEWNKTQNIEVVLTNTGNTDIDAFCLKYKTSGQISGLWGAQLIEQTAEYSLFEASNYNYSLKPGESVSYGYINNNSDMKIPTEIELSSVRAAAEQDFTASVVKKSSYDSTSMYEISIKNNSEKLIKMWELSFTPNFKIEDYWGAALVKSEDETYTFKGEYASSVIPKNAEVKFTVVGNSVATPKLKNTILTEIYSDYNFEKLKVVTLGSYYENEINLNWYANFSENNFEVFYSEDGDNYEKIPVLNGDNFYNFSTEENCEKYYFKAVLKLSNGKAFTSNILTMVKTEDGYEIEPVDSDGDKLLDIFEYIYDTDPNNPDTDGDGLSDYEEIYLTGTDPLKADTNEDGITDDKEDGDNDGLTNLEEIKLGTNPLDADTDSDGLSDGDEVNKYFTDPLNPDTDSDKIIDGDEIKVGLDPNNPSTFGIPDSEYTFAQTVENNDLEELNYSLKIDIKAAGNADNSLDIEQSSFSNAVQNDAVLGKVIELTYDDLKVENATISFEIPTENIPQNDTQNPAFDGANRYSVFKYFEDINMLLPIETSVINNTVSADVTELGTYCLVDMEKWFESFGVDFNEPQPEPAIMALDEGLPLFDEMAGGGIAPSSDEDLENNEELSGEENSEQETIDEAVPDVFALQAAPVISEELKKSPIDVVFVLQAQGSVLSVFNTQKETIRNISKSLFETYSNVRISVVTHDLRTAKILKNSSNEEWFYNYNDVLNAVNSVQYGAITNEYCDRGAAFGLIYKDLTFRDTTNKFLIHFANGASSINSGMDHIDLCNKIENLKLSEIKPIGWHYDDANYEKRVIEAINKMNGLFIKSNGNFAIPIFENINQNVKIVKPKIKVTLPTSWRDAELDGAVVINENTDTDRDGLMDWEELDRNSPLVTIQDSGEVILPTFEKAMSYINDSFVETTIKPYFLSGGDISKLLNAKIFPMLSDPAAADGDDDGVPDKWDEKPLKYGGSGDVVSGNEDKVFQVLKKFSNIESTYAIDTSNVGNPYMFKIYSLPNVNSREYGNPFNNSDYSKIKLQISSVALSENSYWYKVTLKNGVMGYVQYANVRNGIVSELDEVVREKMEHPEVKKDSNPNTPKPILGTNPVEYFNDTICDTSGWYVPEYGEVGAGKRIPRFIQYKSGPCSLLSLMMLIYTITDCQLTPEDYYERELENNQSQLWSQGSGAIWKTTVPNLNLETPYKADDEILKTLKNSLDNGYPAIVAARNSGLTTHYVLVAGYVGSGKYAENFKVIDPWYLTSTYSTLGDFYESYPNDAHFNGQKRIIYVEKE